jgi:hypothetical protein
VAGWAGPALPGRGDGSGPGLGWAAGPVPGAPADGAPDGGGLLGAVTGWFAPSLSGPAARDRLVATALGSRLRIMLPFHLVDPAPVGVLSGGTWSAATGVVLPVDVAMRD